MAYKTSVLKNARGNAAQSLGPLADDPEIRAYVVGLKRKFQKYAAPAGEARNIVDEAMGASSLTEILYKSRAERPA